MPDTWAASTELIIFAGALSGALVLVLTFRVVPVFGLSGERLPGKLLGATTALVVSFFALTSHNSFWGTACTQDGARISEVTPGSLADRSGFQGGDVVLSANGRPGLSGLLSAMRQGGELSVVVLRGGHELKLSVQRLFRRWNTLDSFGLVIPSHRTQHSIKEAAIITAAEIRASLRFMLQASSGELKRETRLMLPVDPTDAFDMFLLYFALFSIIQVPGALLVWVTSRVRKAFCVAGRYMSNRFTGSAATNHIGR